MQFAMSEIQDTQYTVQECIIFYTFPKISHNFQPLHCESTKILCAFHNSLLTSRKIGNWSLDNNLNAERQKGVTQGAVSFHFGILTKIC